MNGNIDDYVFESRCQKCDTLPVITPLIELKGPIEGTILIPGELRCVECFSYMTTTIRKRKDDEKSKKE